MDCCWGRGGFWGWGGIGGWINLLEGCQGGIACDSNRKGFRAFISNLAVVETKTWGKGLKKFEQRINTFA